jgi:LAS superfamily LD-carboxypeptidase LdcB
MKLNNRRSRKKWLLAVVFIIIIVLCISVALVWKDQKHKTTPRTNNTTKTSDKSKKTPKPTEFNKTKYSIDEPGSIWWIVNKNRPAGENYIPPDLTTPPITLNPQKSYQENQVRKELANPLENFFNDAEKASIKLMLASGYRSYQLQNTYYSNYVRTSGEAEANRYSAKPGTSEHQTGMAFDLATVDRVHYLDQAFGDDSAGKWIEENAHKYGFIVRYPRDKEAITGYMYEPWHLRYVGTDLAEELYKRNQTMEEFFGL